MILDHFPYEKPRDGQRDLLLSLEKYWKDYDVFCIVAPTACHGIETQLLMADGSVRDVLEIGKGDLLMGPDSNPREVLEVYEGETDLVRVCPIRGRESYVFTHNHSLSLTKYVTSGRYDRVGGKRYRRDVIDIPINEWRERSKTFRHTTKLWKPNGIDFQTKLQEIDPYLLGVWLGDGNSESFGITTVDLEMIEFIRETASLWELEVREDKITYHITGRYRGNPLWRLFTDLGLKGNKHIPSNYKLGDVRQRLELLAGLIDTDGNYNRKGSCGEITQVREHLSRDIQFILDSLGFHTGFDVREINGKKYFRVRFSGELSRIPLRIKRKRDEGRDSKSNQNNRAFEVSDIGRGRYRGFKVSGDNLYLMSDFTVTHNCGKTAISETLGRWQGNVSLLVPTNLLVGQFLGEFPGNASLSNKNSYKCPIIEELSGREITCSEAFGKHKSTKGCRKRGNICNYLKDQREVKCRNLSVTTYHLYNCLRLHKPLLIMDEAHKVISILQEHFTDRFWRHEWNYPKDMWNYGQINTWLNTLIGDVMGGRKVGKLYNAVSQFNVSYVIQRGMEEWRKTRPHKFRDAIKLIPIDLRDMPPILWPAKVRKVILLSATINRKDIESLGLDRKRVLYLHVDSPIPVERRPVYEIGIASVNRTNIERTTEEIARYIDQVLLPKYRDVKGVIHTTYSQAVILRKHLKGGRYMFHGKGDVRRVFQTFTELPPDSGAVLVACGLGEGIDLIGDLGRWQAIAKVPYPSLGDPGIKYKAERDPEWYLWETMKPVIQACGRISRSPTDMGETYILDSNFGRLKDSSLKANLIPEWFRDSIITREVNHDELEKLLKS